MKEFVMNEISAVEFHELMKKADGPVEVIDVRTPGEFQEVHLNCARNISLDRLEPSDFSKKGLSKVDETPIYFICKSGARGKMACEKLEKQGIRNVVNVMGGTDACLEHGFEVTRGKSVMSLERQVRIAAGTLILMGVLLGFAVHPGFFGLSGFVGAGLVFAGLTNTCGMGMLISKMPWNQVASSKT